MVRLPPQPLPRTSSHRQADGPFRRIIRRPLPGELAAFAVGPDGTTVRLPADIFDRRFADSRTHPIFLVVDTSGIVLMAVQVRAPLRAPPTRTLSARCPHAVRMAGRTALSFLHCLVGRPNCRMRCLVIPSRRVSALGPPSLTRCSNRVSPPGCSRLRSNRACSSRVAAASNVLVVAAWNHRRWKA